MPKAAPKPKATVPQVDRDLFTLVADDFSEERLAEFQGEGGLQIVSYSELDTYRMCPLKHMLGYKERWKKPVRVGSPLSRGSLWHHVMEVHYGVIVSHYPKNGGPIPESQHSVVLAEAWEAVKPYLFDPDNGTWDEDQDTIRWMYEGYVEKYGVDNEWKIIAIEYSFLLPLPNREGQPSQYALKGKIDILAQLRKDGSFWIWDHKSAKDLPTQFALEIDDQFGGYTWAMSVLGYKVMGSMHNCARTARNAGDAPDADLTKKNIKKQTLDQRMKRTLLDRSTREANNIAFDAWATAMNAYPPPGRELPLYSSPDPRQCAWKCDFKEVHLLARKGRDIHEVLREYNFTQDFTRH